MSEYVPYSGIPVILSTISLSTCMVPPHYIRGGTPLLLELIKTLEFISTGNISHVDHTIIFEEFMSYPRYDVLKIPWLGIPKL